MKKVSLSLEILFSMIIFFLVISITIIISINVRKNVIEISKKNEASLIASNIIENMKIRDFNYLNSYIEGLSYLGMTKSLEGNAQIISINGNEFEDKFFNTEIPSGYMVNIIIKDYDKFEILKDINIVVSYYVNTKLENYEVSTNIGLEKIDECNKPIISTEYLKDFKYSESEIIPIKYSEKKDGFIVAKESDIDWYNYEEKKWAKILIFNTEDNLKEKFIEENGNIKSEIEINGKKIELIDYIYVWIPNFSVKDEITYFRYQNSKKIIKFDAQKLENEYIYLNRIGEEIDDVSENCTFDGIYGVWKKIYSEDEYYLEFEKTKYGPIVIK